MKLYVDKWFVRQLKLEEADRLFSGSEKDIEKLVEDYRQSLLMRKVDQYYVDEQMNTDFTDKDIADYYNTHKSDFILDRTLVRGRILRFDASYRQSKKLSGAVRAARRRRRRPRHSPTFARRTIFCSSTIGPSG